MKARLLFSLLCLMSASAYSQDIRTNFEMSYAMYSMSSFQKLQQEFIKASNLPMQAVQSFPSYYGYQFSMTNTAKRNTYGIFFGYNSTAGRVDLEDYSGTIRIDQVLKCFSYGMLYQHQINQSDKWKLFASLHLSMSISNIHINTYLETGGSAQSFDEGFYATSVGFRPGIQLQRVFGRFSIYTAAGYELQSNGILHSENYNNPPTLSDGSTVYTQWGGLRLSAGLGISFSKGEVQSEASTQIGNKASIGIGGGFDFGGFGANILVYPTQRIGLFAGVGYAVAGIGTSVGARVNVSKPSRFMPYVIGMYGYNAAISVNNASQFDRLFYGPSFGFGVDAKRSVSKSFWSLALLVPIRSSEVDEYFNMLKGNGVQFNNSLPPVGVSLGYHLGLN